MRGFLLALIVAGRLSSQTLELHSEFLRVDPQGEILPADATRRPREILSPALARNAFASFHVVVRAEHGNYFLFVGGNPPNVLGAAVYKEEFVKRGDKWIPDTLKPLKLPEFGVIPDPEAVIAGQTARAYLLDVWVPPGTKPGRLRLEVQLKSGSWIISPMELRILEARVPDTRPVIAEPLPAIEASASESAMAPLLDYMGRHGEGPKPGGVRRMSAGEPHTVRAAIRRNAEQDMALARRLDPNVLLPLLKKKMDESRGNGEWYLGVRDLIYRLASSSTPPRPETIPSPVR